MVAPIPSTNLLINFILLPNNHSISVANERSNCLAQASVSSLGLVDVDWVWLVALHLLVTRASQMSIG